MELKTKQLLELMKENENPKSLHSYLNEMVEQDKLTHENLEYLYNNLYKDKSSLIKQNIFPVSQFLIKGYSIEEVEKLANLLPDAHNFAIDCCNENEKGDLFNKMFVDLEFVYL